MKFTVALRDAEGIEILVPDVHTEQDEDETWEQMLERVGEAAAQTYGIWVSEPDHEAQGIPPFRVENVWSEQGVLT